METTTSHADEVRSHAERCAESRRLWPDGPWTNEPDRVEWRTSTGLHAIALRQPRRGHWCGYVGVAPGHPWHGVDLSSYPSGVEHPEVHGGITYSDACVGAVCHVPAPGEPEHLWWVGFDCAHYGDAAPHQFGDWPIIAGYGRTLDTYRTLDFVRGQCERLAEQAARVGRGESLETPE